MRAVWLSLLLALGLWVGGAMAADDLLHSDGFDPSIGFRRISMPDHDDAVPCTMAGNASARIGRVFLAQTHVLETSHPFFALAARRPALLKVEVTGSGAAPAVRVVASAAGQALGSLCLAGPAMLPASISPGVHSRTDSFTVTLPANWLRAGLALEIRAGDALRTLDAAALRIGPEPVLSLLAPDVFLFGDTQPTPKPANWEIQYLSTLLASALDVSPLAPLVTDRLPIEPRGDGNDGFGNTVAQTAQLALRKPSCTAAQAKAGACTRYSGYGVLNGVRGVLGAIRQANGMERFALIYGTLSNNMHVGGGLAGGGVGAGDDYDLTFNHENGHSTDMPHWGGSWYGRADAAAAQKHPYAGQAGTPGSPTGGGFGNSWGYDQARDAFVDPLCAATARERQEPMQRSGGACLPAGQTYDYFSDYSSLFLFRYLNGASAVYAGTVPYPRDPLGNAAATPFSFPSKGGRVVIVEPDSYRPMLKKWNEELGDYVAQQAPTLSNAQLRHAYPERYNTRVVTFWGAFSNTTSEVRLIGTPMRYVGYLKKTWDPTDPADFADIKSWVSGDAFWWGADLVLRVNYSDGTHRKAVLKYTARGTDALGSDSYTTWAVNLPDDKPFISAVLYHRPMEVRYPGTVTPYNINQTGNATTAANYLDGAPIVATWP